MAEYLIKSESLTAIADAVRAKTEKTDRILLSDFASEITNISTGVELGFEVVGGTTEPASPSENMIWVNTDAEITSWIFSATEPESPVDGMVWFLMGTDSSCTFNALKKNSIMLSPLDVSQYIDGVWVKKEAQIYQNSVWVYWWNGELYYYGNQYENITGGWGSTDYYSSDGATFSAPSFADDHMYSDNSSIRVISGTMNAIDLTDINTIIFHVNSTVVGNATKGYFTCYLSPSKNIISSQRVAMISIDTVVEKDLIMDVSNLNGSYYVWILWPAGVKVEVYSCVME